MRAFGDLQNLDILLEGQMRFQNYSFHKEGGQSKYFYAKQFFSKTVTGNVPMAITCELGSVLG